MQYRRSKYPVIVAERRALSGQVYLQKHVTNVLTSENKQEVDLNGDRYEEVLAAKVNREVLQVWRRNPNRNNSTLCMIHYDMFARQLQGDGARDEALEGWLRQQHEKWDGWSKDPNRCYQLNSLHDKFL